MNPYAVPEFLAAQNSFCLFFFRFKIQTLPYIKTKKQYFISPGFRFLLINILFIIHGLPSHPEKNPVVRNTKK
jgi:hypothetical protein